jgi:hypothetical protein
LRVVFYVSGHGFGHAARDLQIVNALHRLNPSLRFTIRSSVPEWFLRSSLKVPADLTPGEVDTGVVQPDSLSVDEDATAARASAFYRDFHARVERERRFLLKQRTAIVVGDAPPLAFAAAAAAQVPSVAVTNFTWDWIYAAYPHFDAIAPGVRRIIADANACATLALRLPFSGGFESMRRIEHVPLVARKAVVPREQTRSALGLEHSRLLVLATFGGHGGAVPLDRAAAGALFTVVATDYELGSNTCPPGLRIVHTEELRSAGLAYTDLLAACDLVVTKLGYGIVSECIANGVPMLYTTRGRFAEQDVFIREVPRVLRCRAIDPDDLRSGRWDEAVAALLAQPAPSESLSTDGAEVVAGRIVQEAVS